MGLEATWHRPFGRCGLTGKMPVPRRARNATCLSLSDWLQRPDLPSKPWLIVGQGPTFACRGQVEMSAYSVWGLDHVARSCAWTWPTRWMSRRSPLSRTAWKRTAAGSSCRAGRRSTASPARRWNRTSTARPCCGGWRPRSGWCRTTRWSTFPNVPWMPPCKSSSSWAYAASVRWVSTADTPSARSSRISKPAPCEASVRNKRPRRPQTFRSATSRHCSIPAASTTPPWPIRCGCSWARPAACWATAPRGCAWRAGCWNSASASMPASRSWWTTCGTSSCRGPSGSAIT